METKTFDELLESVKEMTQPQLPTPSHLLNVLCKNGEMVVNGNRVVMTKNDYFVYDKNGVEVFKQRCNASTFWLLTDFLGITKIENIQILE